MSKKDTKTKKQTALEKKHFGKLELLGESKIRQDYVYCKCSCGEFCDINVYNIISGLRYSCGCDKNPKVQEVLDIGRFGRLTTLKRGKKVSDVLCKCDCGVVRDIPAVRLLNGDNKTCGCGIGTVTDVDRCLEIKKFGRWAVTAKANIKQKVVCVCTCGTIKEVSAKSLLNGNSKSCGCLHSELASARRIEAGTMAIGYRNQSTQGEWFEVTGYDNCDLVYIRFDCNGSETRASAGNIRKGEVRNLFSPSVCGTGYIGSGEYTSKDKAYTHWAHMLSRCYTDTYGHTYTEASVEESWYNYQVFAKWFYNNWVGNLDVALDKDLLIKGNKLYSEHTCSLVPENLNNFPCTSDSIRGDCPLGTTGKNGKICAQIYVYGEHETIGYFSSKTKAFLAYKERKEEVARIYADKYFREGLISEKLRDVLYNYTVDIND